MNDLSLWYKNVDTSFFHFVTKYAFDRQRDGQKGLGALQCGNYNDETHCLNSQLVKKNKVSDGIIDCDNSV